MPCHTLSILMTLAILHNAFWLFPFILLVLSLIWKCENQVEFSSLAWHTTVSSCGLKDTMMWPSHSGLLMFLLSRHTAGVNEHIDLFLIMTSLPAAWGPVREHADAHGNELHMCVHVRDKDEKTKSEKGCLCVLMLHLNWPPALCQL